MSRALIRAYQRGVSVQLLVNRDSARLGRPYAKLQRVLGDRRTPAEGGEPLRGGSARSCLRSCRGRGGNLHSKIFLFSRVGHTKWVSLVGSANLTTKAATGQWNHMDTIVGKATFVRLGRLFRQMKADRVAAHPIYKFRSSAAVFWAFPHPLADPSRDPMVRVLRGISCQATPHTGLPVSKKALKKTAKTSKHGKTQAEADHPAHDDPDRHVRLVRRPR